MKNLIGISGKIGSGKDTVGVIIQILCHLEKIKIPYTTAAVMYNWEKNFKDGKYYGEWHIKKFAYKLKKTVALLTGCTVEDLESQEFKTRKIGKEWDWYRGIITTGDKEVVFVRNATDGQLPPFPNNVLGEYNYRDMLQRLGTEAMRNQIHENVWVNALFADYKSTTYRSEVPVRAAGFIDTEIFPKWIITDTRFPNEAKVIKEKNGILIRVKRTQFLSVGSLATHEHPSETALDDYKFDHVIDNDGTLEELIEKVREILIAEKIIS